MVVVTDPNKPVAVKDDKLLYSLIPMNVVIVVDVIPFDTTTESTRSSAENLTSRVVHGTEKVV